MKIKTTITEIECTANEIRQSNTVADGILNILRGCFNNISSDYEEEEDEEREYEFVNLGNGVFEKRYKAEREDKA